MSLKQKKVEFKPRIKVNHNIIVNCKLQNTCNSTTTT